MRDPFSPYFNRRDFELTIDFVRYGSLSGEGDDEGRCCGWTQVERWSPCAIGSDICGSRGPSGDFGSLGRVDHDRRTLTTGGRCHGSPWSIYLRQIAAAQARRDPSVKSN